MEAGLDSLGAVELRNSVQARFGVELPATVTFDYPTQSALAAFIAQQIASASPAAPQMQLVSNVPTSTVSAPEILEKLKTILRTIVGGDVPADQPLMESGLVSPLLLRCLWKHPNWTCFNIGSLLTLSFLRVACGLTQQLDYFFTSDVRFAWLVTGLFGCCGVEKLHQQRVWDGLFCHRYF